MAIQNKLQFHGTIVTRGALRNPQEVLLRSNFAQIREF